MKVSISLMEACLQVVFSLTESSGRGVAALLSLLTTLCIGLTPDQLGACLDAVLSDLCS